MLVTFVSRCEKNSICKTRKILDSYAVRIGDFVWQTPITEEGLKVVKKNLMRTATRHTSISCHRIKSRGSELEWIVGNRSKFSVLGECPVNSTSKNILRKEWENSWIYMPVIKAVTAISALLHDLGKASVVFQKKLRKEGKISDPLRHEWVSLILFRTMVDGQTDEQWLQKLSMGEISFPPVTSGCDSRPFKSLPELAKIIAWLVVSHHKLPLCAKAGDFRNEKFDTLDEIVGGFDRTWGYYNDKASEKIEDCFAFERGLPHLSDRWCKQIKKWSARLLELLPLAREVVGSPKIRLILHYARLSLMLGDHHYSSLAADSNWPSGWDVFANTDRTGKGKDKKSVLKQRLDEHLVGVCHSALAATHLLPLIEKNLPRAHDLKALTKKSKPPFDWQDKAVTKIEEWLQYQTDTDITPMAGFFAVNMASTGTGKTFANAKIMQVLSEDRSSLRYILALGLRTLTLQTGDEYREKIRLDSTQLAVLIGSKAVMELHMLNKRDRAEENSESFHTGSESMEPLLDNSILDYDNALPEDKLSTVLKGTRDRQFLYAPVLVCTIDHLMAATECIRGGRYILPALRLMSSDLVIDEIDDFDGQDLIAIGRLIHLAGMSGSKVMISSATIPPDLAEGFFNAYQEGWRIYAESGNAKFRCGVAWTDEFSTRVETIANPSSGDSRHLYRDLHSQFVEKRVLKLAATPAKRKARIIPCKTAKELQTDTDGAKKAWFQSVQKTVTELHQHHWFSDPQSDKKLSFGLIRTANIEPCIQLTEFLAEAKWPQDTEIRIMAYHSRQVLLLRSEQEKHLDEVLSRKGKEAALLTNPVIRSHIRQSETENLIFILVATPVEEVGRDHDFDWAILEPSSFRSVIQLAGRVLRHRNFVPDFPNLAIMQRNIKGLDCNNRAVFNYPGPERDETNFRLKTHDMTELIDVAEIEKGITAIPRIKKPGTLLQDQKLRDLEHYSVNDLLTTYSQGGPESLPGWLSGWWWLTALPQRLVRFRESSPQLGLYLVFNEENDSKAVFKESDFRGHLNETFLAINMMESESGLRSRSWMTRDYRQIVGSISEQVSLSIPETSERYGGLAFDWHESDSLDSGPRLHYSDELGMSKRRT